MQNSCKSLDTFSMGQTTDVIEMSGTVIFGYHNKNWRWQICRLFGLNQCNARKTLTFILKKRWLRATSGSVFLKHSEIQIRVCFATNSCTIAAKDAVGSFDSSVFLTLLQLRSLSTFVHSRTKKTWYVINLSTFLTLLQLRSLSTMQFYLSSSTSLLGLV